jgi:hypothetical protein
MEQLNDDGGQALKQAGSPNSDLHKIAEAVISGM